MVNFGSWGLANQMFQFAVLYSMSKDLNKNLQVFLQSKYKNK